MRSYSNWSVGLGRWSGVDVRLHIFFLLFAAFTLYLGWQAAQGGHSEMASIGPISLAVLLISVLLHELGHFHVASRLGFEVPQIVLGPVGGLTPVRAPYDPKAQLWVSLAGPLVNLCLAAACVPLLAMRPDVDLLGLLSPLAPSGLVMGTTAVISLKLIFWINWLLLLINLVPAYPLDGGPALQAIVTLVMKEWDRRRVVTFVTRMAQVGAALLLLLAWIVRDSTPGQLVPAWFPQVLLSIFLFFGAKHELERMDDELPLDGDLGELDLRDPFPPTDYDFDGEFAEELDGLSDWLDDRREGEDQRRAELEAEEDRRVDEILARVHKQGMHSLTDEERLFLQRVSRRYRSRS